MFETFNKIRSADSIGVRTTCLCILKSKETLTRCYVQINNANMMYQKGTTICSDHL